MAHAKRLPFLALTLTLAIAACGGGEQAAEPPDPADPAPGGPGSGGNPEPTYSVGGSLTGLTGTGLLIRNNGADELSLHADGAFAFADELQDGGAYDVTIVTQPTAPDNVCTVANGSGTVAGADVTDVEIECTGPLALTNVAPADGDDDVSRAIEPLLTFSADIDAATVVTGAVTLASDAGNVDMTFAVSGAQVTLKPAAPLLPLTEFTLTITTDVLGTGGERMLDPVILSFKTRDAEWKADIVINGPAGNAGEARVAFDDDGNALALWYQGSFDRTEIWWNYYTAGVGWGTAALLEQNVANAYSGGARLGFDAAGNALAIWALLDQSAGDHSLRGSRFVPGTGWDAPAFIEQSPGDVFGYPELAVNRNGDAVAVWLQVDGTIMNLWANRYSATGWDTPEIVDETDDVVEAPRAAINSDGDILVAWPMREPGNFIRDIYARRYATGSGWQASTLLSVNNVFEAVQPRAVLDDAGNALVVWVQGLGLTAALHGSRYTDATGWSTPAELSAADSVDNPQLALDPSGNVMAVWRQRESVNGMLQMLPYAARYTVAGGWGSAQAIGNRTAFWPKVAVDPRGQAIAVWHDLDLAMPSADAYSVWGNRYTLDNGWTAAEQIGSNGSMIGTGTPNVATDPSGDAFAIWARGAEVRVNRFE